MLHSRRQRRRQSTAMFRVAATLQETGRRGIVLFATKARSSVKPEQDSSLNSSALLQVDGVLRNLIEGCDRLGIGLKGALRHNQIGEFGGDIDVGQFQRSAR